MFLGVSRKCFHADAFSTVGLFPERSRMQHLSSSYGRFSGRFLILHDSFPSSFPWKCRAACSLGVFHLS